jgi:hypothetical protein
MTRYCYYWSVAPVLWKNGNWTWADCELIQEICAKWGSADFWWKNANWRWSECSGSVIPPIPPIPPVASGSLQPLGVDATTLIQPWLIEPWSPYRAGEIKKPKTIELTLRMLGKEYKEKKEVKNFDVGADNVNIRVNPTNIDLTLKE